MKCKACNMDFDPHMRVIKSEGVRVLEDLCATCRRYIYASPTTHQDDAQSVVRAIVSTRGGYVRQDDT